LQKKNETKNLPPVAFFELGTSNKKSNRINSHWTCLFILILLIINPLFFILHNFAHTVFALRFFINAPSGKKLKVGVLLVNW